MKSDDELPTHIDELSAWKLQAYLNEMKAIDGELSLMQKHAEEISRRKASLSEKFTTLAGELSERYKLDDKKDKILTDAAEIGKIVRG